MLTRILTAAIGVVVFFVALAVPTQFFPLVIFAVAALMLYEMYSVLKCDRLVDVIGYASSAVAFAMLQLSKSTSVIGDGFSLFLSAMLMLYLLTMILKHGKTDCKSILAHGFITLYITVTMSFIARIDLEYSSIATLWVFIIAWLTDTGAYFAGVFLGKHKLCPSISPKKTVEGAIGGLLASVIACTIYYFILLKTGVLGGEMNIAVLLSLVAMGLLGSVLSQLGDFVASCIKRDYNVKDYGSILPGHGGIMDRFDSVIFVAPFVYYCLSIIARIFAV